MVSTPSRSSEPSALRLMYSGRLSTICCPPGDLDPALGGDRDLPTERSEGFSHELFVRDEERDNAFDGRPDQRDHLLPVRRRTVGIAHAHAAEPKGRNLQVASSKCALLHVYVSFRSAERA